MKSKRLAELFVIALKIDMSSATVRRELAITGLEDNGLSHRQAERYIEAAINLHERNMLSSAEIAAKTVSQCFRRREHPFILEHVQSIINAGAVTDLHHSFYSICEQFLHHPDESAPEPAMEEEQEQQ